MKAEDLHRLREEHQPHQVGPLVNGDDVRCLSPQHPEGGLPWPCHTIQVVHHVDTVHRKATVTASRLFIANGMLSVRQAILEIPRIG